MATADEGIPPPANGPPGDGKTKIESPDVAVSLGNTPVINSFRVTDLMRGVNNSRRTNDIIAILSEIDRNKDGVINADELVTVLEGVIKSRRERRYMIFGLVALSVFALCTIGAVVGLTYAVVDALKDTQVVGDVMMVKGSTNDVIKVGSADFTIVDGAAVPTRRATNSAVNATAASATAAAANTATAAPDNVLRTASYMGTPMPFTSKVDVQTLMELRYLYIKGPGKVELALMVMGVARVPLANSVHGDVVRIVTSVGTITLDDTVIYFSSTIADVFEEAGFRVSHNRRVLLGAYDVLGFFNFIRNLEAFNPDDPNLPKSELPDENFSLTLKIYEPCVLPINPTVDRCVVVPPEVPPSSGEEDSGVNPEYTADPSGGHRRRLYGTARAALARGIATRPYRSLQGVEASGQDLAGVEVINGVRYMTRNETVVTWNGATQVIYQYALVPNYEKVELSDAAQGLRFTWQRVSSVVAGTAPAIGGNLFCRNSTLTEQPSAALVPPTADAMPEGLAFNYTYQGVDLMDDDTLGRHFHLVVLANDTVSQTVDYWDSPNGLQPLAFVFESPASGRILMKVIDYHGITPESSEAQADFWAPPHPEDCLSPVLVPQLLDSFHYMGGSRIAGIPDDNTQDEVVLSPSERRRLEAQSAERAALWDALDHVNGTGEWPQWALDLYGGEKPGTSSSRRMLQAASCPQMDKGYSFPKGAEPCEGEVSFSKNFNFFVHLECSKDIPGGNGLTIKGNLDLDTCQSMYSGCISLNWEIPGESTLFKFIKSTVSAFSAELPYVKFAEGCISYDAMTGIWTLSMTNEPKLQPDYVDKAFSGSLNKFIGRFVFKGYAGNIWIDEVTIGWDIAFDPIGNVVNAINLAYDLGSQGVALIENAFVQMKDGKLTAVINSVASGATSVGQTVANTVASVATSAWNSVSSLFGRRRLASLIDKSILPKTGIKITREEFTPVTPGNPKYIVGSPATNQEPVVVNKNTVLTVYDLGSAADEHYYGTWMTVRYCGYVSNRGTAQRYRFQGTQMNGFLARMQSPQGSLDDQALTAVRYSCSDNSNTGEEISKVGSWSNWAMCDYGAYIVGARVRAEDWQGWYGDNTVINSIQFRCNKGTGSTAGAPLNTHNGYWGSTQTSWTMCPANTFVCGVQLRVDTSGWQTFMEQSGWFPKRASNIDKKGVSGMRIVCCNP